MRPLILPVLLGVLVACSDTHNGPDDPPGSSGSCPPPPAYPSPACTGVPAGTTVTELPLNYDGVNYRVTTDGEVIDGKHIAGNLLIAANDVVVKNSRIDGFVEGEFGGAQHRFTITDSEVGRAGTCTIHPGVGSATYTATRVHIEGFDDGFRASGPDITIRDSYVKNCGLPSSHGDGIQDYPSAQRLVLDHTTLDLCGPWSTVPTQKCDAVEGHNAPVFINSNPTQGLGSTDVTITNNLILGGVYAVYIYPAHGTWTVTGNRVVNGTWDFGAYETNGQCAKVTTWSDNRVVTIDASYVVTSTVRTDACPN